MASTVNNGASVSQYISVSRPAPGTVNNGSSVSNAGPGGGGGAQVLVTEAGVQITTESGQPIQT